MSQKTTLNFFVAILLGSVLTSCYRAPNDSIYAEDLDMVVTNYDDKIDYPGVYSTYTLSDSFSLVSNSKDFDYKDANNPKFVIPCTTRIKTNMDAMGYTFIPRDQVDSNNVPDIYIPITVTYTNTSGINYYPIYSPGWGYGYGYPGYGYGYGYGSYYYSWSYVPTYFSYDQGSLLIDWIDLKNADVINDTIILADNIWNMGISGLIENTDDSDREERIYDAIDLGFEQSPYLKK